MKEVTLVSGEKVFLEKDSVVFQDQTFIRLGECFIAGIVNDKDRSAVYIWQEKEGTYKNLGDIVIFEQKDNSVEILCYVSTQDSDDFKERSKKVMAEQISIDPEILSYQSCYNSFRLLACLR